MEPFDVRGKADISDTPTHPARANYSFGPLCVIVSQNKLVVPGRIFSLSSLLVYRVIFKYRTFSLGHSLILSKWMYIGKKDGEFSASLL